MDVIASPLYPVFRIGDVIIWDFTGLEKADKMELLTRDDILRPKKKDRNNIIFCKCNFNVKSLIHEKVTSDDILSAWKIAIDELKLDRLAKLFLRDSLYNLYLTRYLLEEPDTILMIRMVYWYYRCCRLKTNDTFRYKTTEVKRKLTKGLLSQREKISKQIGPKPNEITIINRYRNT